MALLLEELIETFLTLIRGMGIQIDELCLRFYGGWHSKEVGLTSLFKLVDDAKNAIPLRKHGITLRMQIVRGLYNFPGLIFEESYVLRKGLGNIRKMNPYPCNHGSCSFWSAVKKKGKKCPEGHCQFRADDLFCNITQKTVDTSICVDALNLAKENPDDWVGVFSSDYDLVPCIIAAAYYSNKIMRITHTDKPPKPYSIALLEQYEIIDKQVLL